VISSELANALMSREPVTCIALPFDEPPKDAEGSPKEPGAQHYLTVGRTYTKIGEARDPYNGQVWFQVLRDDGRIGSYRAELFRKEMAK